MGVLGCVVQNQYLYQAHFQQVVRVTPVIVPVSDSHPAAPSENPIFIAQTFDASSSVSSSAVSSSFALETSSESTVSSSTQVVISSSAESSEAILHSSFSSAASVRNNFPAFNRTMHPVARVPNWGAMRTPAEWNRSYKEMSDNDFVAIPSYNTSELTTPVSSLSENFTPENIIILTKKLYYSTRFFAAYDLDAAEFSGTHAGMDLKLPLGTPVGVVAGGRVQAVQNNDRLGLSVIVEHRHPTDGTFFSIYGHLGTASVRAGQDLEPGQRLGTIGMTGQTSAPHLHLQIDRAQADESAIHIPYHVTSIPSISAAQQYTLHPIRFIQTYRATVASQTRE